MAKSEGTGGSNPHNTHQRSWADGREGRTLDDTWMLRILFVLWWISEGIMEETLSITKENLKAAVIRWYEDYKEDPDGHKGIDDHTDSEEYSTNTSEYLFELLEEMLR